jgi:hydrophobic/amphiphilic exporter-1 (mainly G- bacteria), HAE1 family
MLEWSLEHRAAVLIVAALCFVATFPLNRMVGRDFLPSDDQSEMTAMIDTPVGTSIGGTEKVVAELANEFVKLPEVEFCAPIINERPNHAHLYVRLVDPDKRKFTAGQLADKLRGIMYTPRYRNFRPRIGMPSVLGSGENTTAIQTKIIGPEYRPLIGMAQAMVKDIENLPGLIDVYVPADLNNPEFQIAIDRKRASDLGVRASDVAGAVRLMMSGVDQISTYKEGNEQYDVTMQILPEQQGNPQIIGQLMVPSSKLDQVRLENVASIQRGFGPNILDRYRRQFSVNLNASNQENYPLDAAIREVEDGIKKFGLPPGYSYARSGTAKVLDETTHNLMLAFLLASIFMYMVLAAQFESFLHPFTIMLSLPLAVPFALLSLWITHRTLNLWSALGVFLLLGIVKKNGILQVDYTNKLREEGVPLRQAIIQANHVRLRPILMTTLSIVAGLIPTALGIGAGSGQRSAIAVTIIGGQSLCLLLTLLVTPVSYSIFAELSERGVMKRAHAGMVRVRVGVARVLSLLSF